MPCLRRPLRAPAQAGRFQIGQLALPRPLVEKQPGNQAGQHDAR